jgi:hypothetical protein
MPTYELTMSDGTTRRVTANSPQEAQAQVTGGGASEWGPGARELPNGQVVRYGPRGGMTVLRPATTAAGADPNNPLFVGQGAVGSLSSKERDSLVGARDNAQAAGDRLSELGRFEAINQRAYTGGIQDPISAIPILRAFTPNNVEMRAITNKIAPTLRQANSGAMSDKDLETFKQSIPNVGATGPTNQAIGARLRAGSMRERDYAAFMDEFARANGTTFGAQEKWDEYKTMHPLYDPKTGSVRSGVPSWRQYFGMTKPSRSGAGPNQGQTQKPRTQYTPQQMQAVRSIQGGPRGAGGSRTNPTMVMNQAQYNKLPVGAWYIDDEGNFEQKRR